MEFESAIKKNVWIFFQKYGYIRKIPVETKCRPVILFYFWKKKFVEHGTVTLAIDHNGSSLLIFKEKWHNDANVPKSATNSYSLWVHRLLNDDVWIFWALNATILLIDLLLQTIENVVKNWVDRMGYCKASRGCHLNDVVFRS